MPVSLFRSLQNPFQKHIQIASCILRSSWSIFDLCDYYRLFVCLFVWLSIHIIPFNRKTVVEICGLMINIFFWITLSFHLPEKSKILRENVLNNSIVACICFILLYIVDFLHSFSIGFPFLSISSSLFSGVAYIQIFF